MWIGPASVAPVGVQRVNLDMPQHMVAKLDVHARKRGVTRQALIKVGWRTGLRKWRFRG